MRHGMIKGRKISYTQYSKWLNCPLEWRRAYVDKVKPDDISIHLVFGTAIHEAIQAWLDIWYNQEPYKAKVFDIEYRFKEELLTRFKADSKTLENGETIYPCDKDTLREFYIDGCEILKYVRKHAKTLFPTSGHELVGCEVALDLEVASNVRYVGYLDIVVREKRTGKIIIYDLKTSGKGWRYEKTDPKKLNQLLLYKHFYSTHMDVELDDIEVKFIILKRKLNAANKWDKRVTEFEPSHGKPSINKAVRSFNDFLAIFDSDGDPILEKLEPTPSKSSCRFCPFKATEHCSVGVI